MSPEAKRTLRTAVQFAVLIAAALPTLVLASGLSEQVPGVAAALAVSLAVTRVMQIPAVQPVLRWLALDLPQDDADA